MTNVKTSRTVRTKVYKFAGLSKEAKEKAIQWYKDGLYEDPFILEGFTDYCEERAKDFEFTDIQVGYSLSYSQGDGLSFSGSLNTENFILNQGITDSPLRAKIIAANIVVEIKGNTGRYSFASKSDIDVYLDNPQRQYTNVQKLVDRILSSLEDTYMELCKELERTGYKWLEDAYSDENAIQMIEANEYEFLKDGTRY